MRKTQNTLCKSPITSLGYDLYSALGQPKSFKNSFQATSFKVEEISTTFQGFAQKFKDFQEKMEFKDSPLKFKDFSRLCKPWIVSVQFITNHCSNILSVKIVWKHSPLDLFVPTNDSGLPQSRSDSLRVFSRFQLIYSWEKV